MEVWTVVTDHALAVYSVDGLSHRPVRVLIIVLKLSRLNLK